MGKGNPQNPHWSPLPPRITMTPQYIQYSSTCNGGCGEFGGYLPLFSDPPVLLRRLSLSFHINPLVTLQRYQNNFTIMWKIIYICNNWNIYLLNDHESIYSKILHTCNDWFWPWHLSFTTLRYWHTEVWINLSPYLIFASRCKIQFWNYFSSSMKKNLTQNWQIQRNNHTSEWP